MLRKKTSIILIYSLIFLCSGTSITYSSDLLSRIEEMAAKIAPNLSKMNVVIGPVYSGNNKQTCTLSNEIMDLLHIELVNLKIQSAKTKRSDLIMLRLQTSDYEFSSANKEGLFQDNIDAVIISTIGDNAIGEYILKIKVYEVKSGDLIAGGSSYISSGSSYATELRDCLGADNPYSASNSDLAQYESQAISLGYGTVPGDAEIKIFSILYENKITDHMAFSGLVGSVSIDDTQSHEVRDETKGFVYSAKIRFYPFYKGRGLRGFFFGVGIGAASLEETDEDIGKPVETSSSNPFLTQFEFGRKVTFGKNMLVEPSLTIFSAYDTESSDMSVLGWLNLSIGLMW